MDKHPIVFIVWFIKLFNCKLIESVMCHCGIRISISMQIERKLHEMNQRMCVITAETFVAYLVNKGSMLGLARRGFDLSTYPG